VTREASGNARPTRTTTAGPTDTDADKVDGRVRRSRDRVLATAFELLSESGVGGFTVDEVVRRSGVAKTTVYRHWPTRESLILDAASQISAAQEVPDTGSLEGDVTALLVNLAHLLSTARWASVVPSIVDVAERDPGFAELHGRIQRGHASAFRAVLLRAVSRGELPSDADASTLISALVGPLYYRRWFSREPNDAEFVHSVIHRALPEARRGRTSR
jgi:AcrR family transcriptional regulator